MTRISYPLGIILLFTLVLGGLVASYGWVHSPQREAGRIKTVCASDVQDERRDCYAREIASLASNKIPTAFRTIELVYGDGITKGCHYALHPIGAAAYRLYAESGATDFMVANAAMCNYGFYHGFIISLLSERGDARFAEDFCESLPARLLAERPDARDQCYHGIGHGILDEYLDDPAGREADPAWVRGALFEGTVRAVTACESVAQGEEARNCYSGIFHEAAMLQEERSWYTDPADPLWLCARFEGEHRSRCTGNMARLYFKVHPEVSPSSLISRLSETYGMDSEVIEDIVWRFGYRTSLMATSSPAAAQTCASLPQAYRLSCMNGALAARQENASTGNVAAVAMNFCTQREIETLSSDARTECVDRAFEYFKKVYPVSRVEALCAAYARLHPSGCDRRASWLSRLHEFFSRFSEVEPSGTFNLSKERDRWTQVIRDKGAQAAYLKFKQYYTLHNSGSAHTASHLMGDLLYDALNIKGLAICDDSFGFGCYHQLLGHALSEYGTLALQEIGRHCETNYQTPQPCFHGIGHGLNGYFGEGKLLSALSACDGLDLSRNIVSCQRGVFMDYNAPLTHIGDELYAEVRSINEGLFSPCEQPDMPSRFKSSCYFSLPHWWFQQPQMNIARIGSLCTEVPELYQDTCYEGIGIDLPGSVSYDQQRIVETCVGMPDEGSRRCLESSAFVLSVLGFDSCLVKRALSPDEVLC